MAGGGQDVSSQTQRGALCAPQGALGNSRRAGELGSSVRMSVVVKPKTSELWVSGKGQTHSSIAEAVPQR
jgi:hypothetical protein